MKFTSRLASLLALPLFVGPAALARNCPGDCNGNGRVTAADLTRMVALILRCDGQPDGCSALPHPCPAGDLDSNGQIDVGDLLGAIDAILTLDRGCPPTSTPSFTATATATEPPTLTSSATATPQSVATATTTPPPVPTLTATPSPNPSPTPTATSTYTPAPAVCGNGAIEPGETCDDGNTVTAPPEDRCPADCTILTCTPSGERSEVAVQFSSPRPLASIAVLIEYPDGRVQLPGTGDDASVAARVANRPSGFLATIFDFDYALRVGLAGTRALSGTQLFRIQFDLCRNATSPPQESYRCVVIEANDTAFQPVSGATCTIAAP